MTTQQDHHEEDDPRGSLGTYEARWIEQTVQARALLSHGITKPLTDLLEEVDDNLRSFNDGDYPPGSDELYGIYYDAITRAAIPYGHPPMSVHDVAEQLRSIGVHVPTIDLATIGTRTGITPLHPHEITTKLDTATPPEVTLYGRPNCVACTATERALKKADITYAKINLDDRPGLVETPNAQGRTNHTPDTDTTL